MSNSSTAGGSRQRCVIEGVPRVGFFPDVKGRGGKPWPEDFIFPSCLRAILEYQGDTRNDYVYLMGVSGAAFFLNWGGWCGDNSAVYYMSADLGAVFRHTFEAIGLGNDPAPVRCGPPPAHAEAIRERIIAETDAGRPCLAHGVVGPPETCIVTGYDDGGDVLIGWSFFQSWPDEWGNESLEFEPCGYFRKRGWEAVTWDVMAVGEQKARPDRKQAFREALAWGLQVARTARSWQGRANGIAAFDAWIDHLQRDDVIADWKPGDTDEPPFNVHRDATDVIAEGRWYASRFLARETPECMPYQASHLYAAASCYAAEHELMWRVWANEGGNARGEEQRAKFADPDVRRRSVGIIGQARDLDRQAADHIEAALNAAK